MWFFLVSVPWVLEKCILLLCVSHSVVSDPHVTPWTVTRQAPLLMGFSKQEYSRQGVGSHSLLQGIFPTQGSNLGLLHCRRILSQGSFCYAESESEVTQSCPTLCDPMDCKPTRLLHPWDFPGNTTGVGCHFLLHGIFLTQGLNPGLLHCRQTLYRLSHWRSAIG